MKQIQLIPAYGRDYTSRRQVIEDLAADKDFIIADATNRWDGKPANVSDLATAGYESAVVRYKGLRQVAVINLTTLNGEKP